MNKKLVSALVFSTIAITNFNYDAQAQIKDSPQIKPQPSAIGNKQNLQELFDQNIERSRQRERERPIREAQEAVRINTGLVGKWNYSITDSNGDSVGIQSWIRSDGNILYYRIPDRSQPVPIGGFVVSPHAKSTWGYENGILTENSNNGTTNYQVDRVSRDELVLKVISSTAGVNSGTQYTYRKKEGIGANMAK